jgi:heme oxygenase
MSNKPPVTLRDLTKPEHDSVEKTDFAELLLGGTITPAMYHVYLNAQFHNYTALEVALHKQKCIPKELEVIYRAELIYKDIMELEEEFDLDHVPDSDKLNSVKKYQRYIKSLRDDGEIRRLLAHSYVRHFGDLHGGQIIKKRVPGSGSMYQFENRRELITEMRKLLDIDMADEAKICFEFAESMFEELAETYDFETFGVTDEE